ncbi:MAG: dihydroneopterin aldolase [Dysgonamonadaceae bacterium]|jgi:dihydroneopterin aldolase|nr:dihydroneopterin aldolase [Dysgonamonadaceae bacterium]
MQSNIQLTGLEFYAFHGVGEQERKVGNTFLVDIAIDTDISQSLTSDLLADTVNYAEIYARVKQEMAIPSHLLEHVAGRILTRLLEDFPQIKKATVEVAKRNPPVGGQVAWAKVTVSGENK